MVDKTAAGGGLMCWWHAVVGRAAVEYGADAFIFYFNLLLYQTPLKWYPVSMTKLNIFLMTPIKI